MKKKLQKQMDSMMEMTIDAITKNKKLVPALNELFKYAPEDDKYQFILLHEIANQYLHELLDIDGICGGYNLHFAWATGYLCARQITADQEA